MLRKKNGDIARGASVEPTGLKKKRPAVTWTRSVQLKVNTWEHGTILGLLLKIHLNRRNLLMTLVPKD